MTQNDPYAVHVEIDGDYDVEPDALLAAAWHALNICQAKPAALAVMVASSEHVHQLNRDYAGNDYPTDVLSFSPEQEPYPTEPDQPPYIGDVIIAYPIAQKQAADAGHTVLAELQTLAIHGTLHLLGFDHQTPDQQAEMWAYQSAALDAARAEGW